MSQLKEDQQSQIEQLQELKKKVHISSNRLLELTYSDNKYMAKLLNYNAQASKLIAADYIQEALVYLLEAEKMLEYGASCGKIIDRNIIITILHNQACCYYKDSDLHAAAKYIEGVIFNLKTNLDSLQSSPATSGVIDSEKGRKNNEFIYATIQKKIQLIQYYLKFCTINSQAKKRQIALQAGSKVKSVCANFFQDMISDNPKIHACDQNNKEAEIMDLKLLLKNLRIFKQQIAISQLQNYIKCTRYYIKKWNENKVIKKIHFALQKHVNNYSISEVIDMIPMQYHQDDSLCNAQNLNTKVIMRQILHFSMGYFTVSTQYRLIAESLYKNQQQKQKSQQFIKSNINHLLAILFLAFNLNCDLLFMKQIISSYQHHFKISLSLSDNNQDDQIQEQCCALLFNVAKPKPKINHQALIQKITKLKIKEKEVKKKIHTQYQDSYTYDHQVGIKTNQSKVTTKTKRSVSKKQTNGISSSKNLHKTVNQTIMEDSKLLNRSKDRSISKGKQSLCGVKKRSKSKDVFNLSKQLKLSRDPIKIQEKHTKKGHDEYQLCNTKLHSKKRVNSVSSDRSVSFHNRKESKSKLPTQSQKMKDKKMPKKRTQTKVQTINKKKKSKKQSSTNKNYYL